MSDAKPRAGVVTAVRLDERLRYLTDLAAQVTGQSLTDYIASALENSFRDVTLRRRSEPEPEYGVGPDDLTIPELPDAEEERLKDAEMSIAKRQDALWNVNEFQRIEMLKILAPHLLTERQSSLFSFVHAQERYRISKGRGYVIDRDRVNADWTKIISSFEQQVTNSQRAKERKRANH